MLDEDDLPLPEEELPARASARLGASASARQKNNDSGSRQRARCCKGDCIDIVKSRPCSGGSVSGCIWGLAAGGGRSIGRDKRATIAAVSRLSAPDCLIREVSPPNL